MLLTLAEAEFFRLRWSATILDETQKAIEKILADKDVADATVRASRARASMEAAFEEATVVDFDQFLSACEGLPDENDAHVVASALKTQAAVIVTDNLRDFPEELLRRSNLEARSADAFIADTIALDTGRAVAAVRRMRERFRKPEKNRRYPSFGYGGKRPYGNRGRPKAPHSLALGSKEATYPPWSAATP
ncbi:PIN domain-containing protein [Sinorhizobium meliloti]|uniref:PIN domain-containing protein n=1 Tax=Rhizobium meliloti TaxID=382 RepID=UPI001F429C2C|nr:PIN domain-containing protein [Sinorhizobium meliloti]